MIHILPASPTELADKSQSNLQQTRESLQQVKARRGTIALSHQIIDFALHGPHGSPNRNNDSETLCSLIDALLDDGDATPTPSLAGNASQDAKLRHLNF